MRGVPKVMTRPGRGRRQVLERTMKKRTNASTEQLELARQITNDLFRVGKENQAKRLILEGADGRELGGWCWLAVRHLISSHLGPLAKALAENADLRRCIEQDNSLRKATRKRD